MERRKAHNKLSVRRQTDRAREANGLLEEIGGSPTSAKRLKSDLADLDNVTTRNLLERYLKVAKAPKNGGRKRCAKVGKEPDEKGIFG